MEQFRKEVAGISLPARTLMVGHREEALKAEL